MPSQKLNLDQPIEPTDSTEARMRLALGLTTRPAATGHGHSNGGTVSHDSSRQRRRFAQDGEVPVVILNRSRDSEAGGENKLAALAAELRDERGARVRSERALEEANLAIQSLKTKLAHTEMTYEERLRDERESRTQTDALLLTEQETRRQAEIKAAEAALAVSVLERKLAAAAEPVVVAQPKPDLFDDDVSAQPVTKTRAATGAGASKKRALKKAKVESEPALALQPEAEEEDKPIEWWLPSFRASRKPFTRRKRVAG